MNSKTKKMTTIAMLSAMAFLMVALFRIPVVLFLKYEPKDVIITLGGFIWGPLTSFLVSLIASLVEMVTISDTGIWGVIMNILGSCSFACTAAFIYKKKRTLSGAVIGLAAGILLMVPVMLLWNYLITPIYMGQAREKVAKLLIPAFLPFNLIKGGLNAAITFVLYKPVTTALRKTGFITSVPGQPASNKKPVALWIIAGIIIITCVLLILSNNGVI